MAFGFRVKQLDYDLTPVAGLALVGHQLQRLTGAFQRLDREHPAPGGMRASDIVRSYVGLLAQGKSDFDAIEAFRGDRFFRQALGLVSVPSSPTLRQRLDAKAAAWFDWAFAANGQLLRRARPDYGLLPCGWLPLDVDTFAMDNSGTAKDGVGRTYAGVDGYCPLAAYLGAHGFCLDLALRPGTQHSACETGYDLERVVPLAQQLSAAGPKAPILVRMDAGFDASSLMVQIARCNAPGQPRVDWLIKWNPRSLDVQALGQQRSADPATVWTSPRAGKRIAVWEEAVQVAGITTPLRRILRLIGQQGLLGPLAPLRHLAKRRRIKTVMQELIYRAARVIRHAGTAPSAWAPTIAPPLSCTCTRSTPPAADARRSHCVPSTARRVHRHGAAGAARSPHNTLEIARISPPHRQKITLAAHAAWHRRRFSRITHRSALE